MSPEEAAFGFTNQEDQTESDQPKVARPTLQNIGQDVTDEKAGVIPPANMPPQPDWKVRPLSPAAEYVSGGSYVFIAKYIRSLQPWIDDLTHDFGEDTYERMLLDSQVFKCFRTIKLLALGEPLTPRPVITDEDDPQYELSKEITEFVVRCCERLELLTRRTMNQWLYEMLDAMGLGNKVAEQTAIVQEYGKDAGSLVPWKLKTKPRRATSFVVDPFMNLIGLLGLIPGSGAPILTGAIVGDPAVLPNMLRRDKFAVMSWEPVNQDPRGTSLLRSAYNPWYAKMQEWAQFLKCLAQFGTPSLWGTTAENAQPRVPTDSLGNPTGAQPIPPEQEMVNQLLLFQNGSAGAGPFGSDVKILQATGKVAEFIAALGYFDNQIASAITNQILATEESTYDTQGGSKTHQDILGLGAKMAKIYCEHMVRADLFYQWVRWNYGDEIAERLTPRASLTSTEQQDWTQKADAIGNLWKSGYLGKEHLATTDEMLNLPAREVLPEPPTPGVPSEEPGANGSPKPNGKPQPAKKPKAAAA